MIAKACRLHNQLRHCRWNSHGSSTIDSHRRTFTTQPMRKKAPISMQAANLFPMYSRIAISHLQTTGEGQTHTSSHSTAYSHNKQVADQPPLVQTLNARLVNSFPADQCSHAGLRIIDKAGGNQIARSFMQVHKTMVHPRIPKDAYPHPVLPPPYGRSLLSARTRDWRPSLSGGLSPVFPGKYQKALSAACLFQAAECRLTENKGTDPMSVQIGRIPHLSCGIDIGSARHSQRTPPPSYHPD